MSTVLDKTTTLDCTEVKTQFRQIGNSLGIIVPANIRKIGGFSAGDEVSLHSPRPGVITVSSVEQINKNKIQDWNELQDFVSSHASSNAFWPKDKSFKEILNEVRDEKFKKFESLG